MTHEEIFQAYLDDKCPCCGGCVDSESQQGYTEHGGKCMAKNFYCRHCHSEYIVGFDRSSYPIKSEVTQNRAK